MTALNHNPESSVVKTGAALNITDYSKLKSEAEDFLANFIKNAVIVSPNNLDGKKKPAKKGGTAGQTKGGKATAAKLSAPPKVVYEEPKIPYGILHYVRVTVCENCQCTEENLVRILVSYKYKGAIVSSVLSETNKKDYALLDKLVVPEVQEYVETVVKCAKCYTSCNPQEI